MLAQGEKRGQLLFGIVDERCGSENDHRTVVHRVIEDGAGQHQSIEQRNRDADRDSVIQVAQHATCGGTVDVQHVSVASVGGWDHVGLAVHDEAHVAEKPFVEDAVNGVAVVDSAIGLADDARARGWHGVAGHGADFLGRRQEW